MSNFMSMLLTPEFFFSILRISAPIIFATLAAIVVEKAGFCNIGIEGLMMFSALSGSLVSYYAGSWFWGLLAALVVGDRLYTDIACGVNAGVGSAFVLSGEGTLADLEASQVKPTWVFDDIAALHRALREEGNHGQHR